MYPHPFGVSPLHPEHVLKIAREALRYVCGHAETDGRSGGYFGLFPKVRSHRLGTPVVFQIIGRINPNKRGLAKRRAQEKPRRLNQHPDQVSSYQSRDEKQDRWGGAIATRNYYLSFSGLPELCDEALTLIVARTLGLLNDRQARRIAGISKNRLFMSWADTQRV